MTVRFSYDLRSHWIGTVRDLKGKRTVCKAKAKRKGAHGSLSGSSRVDGGGRVIDIGTRNRTIVVFDNDLTIGLNVSDGAEAGMFRCGGRTPPFNTLPYYRIFFR